MSWLRKRRGTQPEPPQEQQDKDLKEARAAREAAVNLRHEVEALVHRTAAVSTGFRQIRVRNHLGESIEMAMRPRKKTRGFPRR